MKNIIFLDIDGVLNCEIHYRNSLKPPPTASREEFKDYHICKERLGWLNDLCAETESGVVISSTWRGDGLEEMRKLFRRNGATFDIIDVTPYCKCRNRGCEIKQWLEGNVKNIFGEDEWKFHRYVIIDDDSDMLLRQAKHFFQTDGYSGLTPNTIYRIRNFLNSVK